MSNDDNTFFSFLKKGLNKRVKVITSNNDTIQGILISIHYGYLNVIIRDEQTNNLFVCKNISHYEVIE